MSARPHAYASIRRDGITAEMRAFWPWDAPAEQVEEAIQDAADEAVADHRKWRAARHDPTCDLATNPCQWHIDVAGRA